MIKAPFNFVSLPKKAYCPEWANEVSQDIPFEDGVSGIISIKFTAETPVFVRNGHKKEEAPTDINRRGAGDFPSFCKTTDGRYFLPGSSVKGMIRNIMEIMTYGRLHVDKDAMFAQREWGNYPLFPFVAPKGASKDVQRETLQVRNSIHCGWLKKEIDEEGNVRYFIKKCPTFYRINHKRIDEFLNMPIFENAFGKHKVQGKLSDDQKTSSYKYSLLSKEGPEILEKLKAVSFKKDEVYACKYQENRVMPCDHNDNNYIGRGTIVFTGQPDTTSWSEQRGMGDGKFYEFLFPEGTESIIEMNTDLYNNYNFIFSALADWKDLKKKMLNEGLPVFFREKTENGMPVIKDLGLAFLYKLPYENTPYNIEEKYRTFISGTDDTHVDANSPDMAACIFGYTNSKTKKTLKGRVQVSPFFCTKKVDCKEYRLTLNSPKASYYPIYIQQTNVDNTGHVKGTYNTYNDGILSGWKRYNLRNKIWEKCSPEENNKIDTYIQPLGTGSTFEGIIRFHNLKKIELGALLSALTFFGNKDCQHQIGQAKSYGFGRMSYSDVNLEIVYEEINNGMVEYYMALFEEHMNKVLNRSWHSSDPIVNLLSMSHTIIKDDDNSHYMTLSMKDVQTGQEAQNDFLTVKNNKEYLRDFNAIYGINFIPESKQHMIQQYEIREACMNLDRSMKDNDYEQVTRIIEKIRSQEYGLEESIKQKINNYEIQINELNKKEDTISKVGNSTLKDYISGVRYIGPFINKIIDWCIANDVTMLQEEQINIVGDMIQKIYEDTPEKKRKNVSKDISKALAKLKLQGYIVESSMERIMPVMGL